MLALKGRRCSVTAATHELFRRSALTSRVDHLFWDLPEVADEAPCGPSSGSTSPDLGDTWRQGMPMSPQCEGVMILDSDDNSDLMSEDECEDELGSEVEREARDNISEVRESSLWAPSTPHSGRCAGLAHCWAQVVRRDIVSRIRRILVLPDENVNTTPQMTSNWYKKNDELIQLDNKLRIGTRSGRIQNSGLNMITW